MLKRIHKYRIESDLKSFPAVAILGPRQVGKTTLAKQLLEGHPRAQHLDLELPSDLAKLTEAESYLKTKAEHLVCIDEVQLRPDLFPLLRALIDADRRPGRFLILGSSSPELLRQASETLAGRIAYNFLTPFTQPELVDLRLDWQEKMWRGGFPDSVLARDNATSYRWRENYIETFLHRDLRGQFNIDLSPAKVRRLWTMCAHLHGQLLNYSKLAQSLDQTHPTVSGHIDILESTFMVRRLLPFVINTKKRLVKSPKIYIRDSGLLATLLAILSVDHLYGHPAYGAVWEGFAIESILNVLEPKSMYGFFHAHTGEEIDLVLQHKGKLIGIECKASSAPKLSPKNFAAKRLLELDQLFVLTPDSDTYPLDSEGTTVTSLGSFLDENL